MIFYDNSSWILPVFSWFGTVWPTIKKPFLILVLYMFFAFLGAQFFQVDWGQNGPNTSVIGGTLSFLLIFRANQAYSRYWDGRTCVSLYFTNLRDFLMLASMYLHGEKDKKIPGFPKHRSKFEQSLDLYQLATNVRIDLVRLCLAHAVVLKMHTRIAYDGYCFGRISGETKWLVDWDRFRLRQLLKEDEFGAVDRCIGIIDEEQRSGCTLDELVEQFRGRPWGPPSSWPQEFEVMQEPASRPHVVIMFYIKEVLFANVNDVMNQCPWGIKERFVPPLSKLLYMATSNFETINQIIATPLPLSFACLCKSLMLIFLAALPCMLTDADVGPFGSIFIPMMVALALLGIDATATELENPFGDDANDLDVMEFVHGLEDEAMQMLKMCGDFRGKNAFSWRTMPAFMAGTSCKALAQQLVVEAYASEEDVGVDEGSYRSGSASVVSERLESQGSQVSVLSEDV